MLGPKAYPQAALRTPRVALLKRGMISEISMCQTATSKHKLKGGQIPPAGSEAAAYGRTQL